MSTVYATAHPTRTPSGYVGRHRADKRDEQPREPGQSTVELAELLEPEPVR